MPWALIINTFTDVSCELLLKLVCISFYCLSDSVDILTAESVILCQFYGRFQPEFGFTFGLYHVDVHAFFLVRVDFEGIAVFLFELRTHGYCAVVFLQKYYKMLYGLRF